MHDLSAENGYIALNSAATDFDYTLFSGFGFYGSSSLALDEGTTTWTAKRVDIGAVNIQGATDVVQNGETFTSTNLARSRSTPWAVTASSPSTTATTSSTAPAPRILPGWN